MSTMWSSINFVIIFVVTAVVTDEVVEPPPCNKNATQCVAVPAEAKSCLGVKLPYNLTSTAFMSNETQSFMQTRLQYWHYRLRNLPKCWSVVQPLLCAFYVPKCEFGHVFLPPHNLCKRSRSSCRVLEMEGNVWPEFLQCEKEAIFPSSCEVEDKGVLGPSSFNTTGTCPSPLVFTTNNESWYDGWEGCGLQCQDPLVTEESHREIHTFIAIWGTICLFCSLFTVLSFFIDWKSSSKYPALIIFYISWCFLIGSIGWLAQFSPGVRNDVLCRKDGTLRKHEPSSGENLSCVIVFIMVYYTLLAAVVWFAILSYTWYVSFRALGKMRDFIEPKTAYFHIAAWSLPLVFTILILALGQVDGNSVSGICFVGQIDRSMQVVFVLVPVGVVLLTGTFFLTRGLVILVKLKIKSALIIKDKANAKIRETIIRIGSFSLLSLLLFITTFSCHVYELTHQEEWERSLRKYIFCKSNLTKNPYEECSLESYPSVAVMQLHLLCYFGSGAAISTWVWTNSTVDGWKRFLRRVFRQPINEPIKLRKHKMISKAFAKRKDLHNGHISISFNSTYDDPLGMKFDLNSAASQEISSTWQAAIPKFITRRGAGVGANALGLRRNSSASEISQHKNSAESYASRRHSLDSQISLHLSEHERKAYLAQARQQRRRRKRRDSLKRRDRNPSSAAAPVLPGCADRRGSDVSQNSDFNNLRQIKKLNNLTRQNTNDEKAASDFLENLSNMAGPFQKRNDKSGSWVLPALRKIPPIATTAINNNKAVENRVNTGSQNNLENVGTKPKSAFPLLDFVKLRNNSIKHKSKTEEPAELNNGRHSGTLSSVVDAGMDSDNRDSSSS